MPRTTALLLACLAFGCSDGAPTLDTGLAGGTPVGDLSAEQAQQVCRGAEQFVTELVGPARQEQLRCTLAGVAFELAGLGSCEGARNSCYDEGTTETVEIDLACDEVGGTYLPGCEATIGQLEACANDVGGAVDAVLDQVTCALVDDEEGRPAVEELEATTELESYESCAQLSEACLAFLELPELEEE